jgi:outer membrane immunogenic protein
LGWFGAVAIERSVAKDAIWILSEQGYEMTRNLLLSSVASVALLAAGSVGAVAADLPVKTYTKAPVVFDPAPSWTGFYVGGSVGGGWNTNSWTNLTDVEGINAGVPAGNGNANGILGGFQGGFNYQIAPKVVIGIEGDYNFANIKGETFLKPRDHGGTDSSNERNIASVTGRIGALYHDDILIYVKGGWAWSQFRHDVLATDGSGNNGVYPTVDDNRSGGTLGFGTEYKIDRNWSAKIEYDYYDFGKRAVIFPPALPINLNSWGAFRADISEQTHVIKVGVNYNFGWFGPVVAKY